METVKNYGYYNYVSNCWIETGHITSFKSTI